MKISALRVEVNGELVAIAGASGLSILSGTIALGSGQGQSLDSSEIMFSVIGLNVHGPQPKQLTWGKGINLQRGDKVTFQVVEVEQPSPPDQVLASPSSAQLEAESNLPIGNKRKRPQ